MTRLPRVTKIGRRRKGRGYGSGRGGHTTGRGMKGQKSRSNLGILFEGIKVKKSLLRRLPLKRGKDKFKAMGKTVTVTLDDLNKLRAGSTVTSQTFTKKGEVKVLGSGKLEKKLKVMIPASKPAIHAIEKAGGSVKTE